MGPPSPLDPAEIAELFQAHIRSESEQYISSSSPSERKQLCAELSAYVVNGLLQGGMASVEVAACSALAVLLLLTDTERLALGIDVVAKAGAMQAVLQCLVEHKGATHVPKLACQVCKGTECSSSTY